MEAVAAEVPLSDLGNDTRSLVRAALLLELCDARGASGGMEACAAIPVCTWRRLNSSAMGAAASSTTPASLLGSLLTQLLRNSTYSGPSDVSAERCVPANLEAVISPYLVATAPEACTSVYDYTACLAAAPRCFWEDHFDHAHCMPDWQFVRGRWSWPSALAQAAEQASFLCNPESNWLDSHDARAPRLSQAACMAVARSAPPQQQVQFTVDPAVFSRLMAKAVAVGILSATEVTAAGSPPLLPSPPQPAVMPQQELQSWKPVRLTAPTCELVTVGRAQCTPSLLGLAAAALEALEAPAHSLAVHAITSEPGRTLLAAAEYALECVASSAPSSGGGPSAAAACAESAAAAFPAARGALTSAFAPSCGSLSNRECSARRGCTLEAHGDHFDCVRSQRYAAEYLTTPKGDDALNGGDGPGAVTGANSPAAAAVAAAAQSLAQLCRSSITTCGQRPILNATLIPAEALSKLSLAARGMRAAPSSPGAAVTNPHGQSPPSSTSGSGSVPSPQQEGDPEAADGDGQTDDHAHADDEDSDLIAGVFVVLVAGVLGCCVPWLMRGWLQARPLLDACLRSLSAGLILSLALVHVAMHAIVEMDGLVGGGGGEDDHAGHDHRRRRLHLHRRALLEVSDSTEDVVALAAAAAADDDDYGAAHDDQGHSGHSGGGRHAHPFPIGMCVVIFGFLLMAVVESIAHELAKRYIQRQLAAADGGPVSSSSSRELPKAATAAAAAAAAGGKDTAASKLEPDAEATAGADVRRQDDLRLQVEVTAAAAVACSSEVPSKYLSARLLSTAAMFELGCICHSFIIGLSLGTSTTVEDCTTLLIALSLHQFFEGIALASVLLAAGLRQWRLASMVASYSVICPAGIAVGIAIVDMYDSHSTTARAVQY
ncbi:hypothetical protein GPECTOR_49g524 [Gonium pectorale]|uniref:Uncharacterized protein n=1 Tax=Gonium pectorale TaxID=33097 RepID=A0A150G9A4_GONPE|nr:hypothetical protein GPECTOR_49g524 [Gonium pectorale]|eukprot:KXZ45940.1 hypothetical protein GPECTOR_49g524 [Gonium pectorale]